MSQVTLEALAERVEKLEQVKELESLKKQIKSLEQTLEQVINRLAQKQPEPVVFKDWRQGIGLMPGGDDEFHKQFDEELRQAREAERQAAREEADREENGK